MAGRARLIAAVAVAAFGAVLLAPVIPAAPALAATTGSVRIDVAPASAGVLGSGSLDVAVGLANGTSAAIPAGTVRLALEQATIADEATLVTALAKPAPYGELQGYGVGTASTPAVPAGGRARVTITVPAAVVTAYTKQTGAHLLAAQLQVRGSTVATGAATVTRRPAATQTVRFASLVPLALPAAEAPTGLASSDLVENESAPGGAWWAALEAARADPSATVALDPAVLASIRLLGSQAPSGSELLTALAALPNPTVELPWADGDVTLERAAGATRVLEPTGIGSTVDLTGSSPRPTTTPTPRPTPTPAATAGTGGASDSSLTRWDWARSTLAWPQPATAGSADLAFLRASGYAATLLSSNDVVDTAARRAAGPLATIGSSKVLVADAAASSLLDAAARGDGLRADAATASLVGLLAVDATAGGTTTVLAVPGRTALQSGRLDGVLSTVRAQTWIGDADLGDLLAEEHPASVRLEPHGAAGSTVAAARDLVTADATVQRLGAAVTTGRSTVTGPYRLATLAMLSVAWRADAAAWPGTVVDVARGERRFVSEAVRLLPTTTVNNVGTNAGLPVYVQNSLDVPVRVAVTGVPSNNRMIVQDTATATIGADQTSQPIKLPTRSISNGEVQIRVTLRTPGGLQLGRSTTADVTVNAGWDTLGAGIFMGALLLLFAVGVYRNLTRKRRRARAATA